MAQNIRNESGLNVGWFVWCEQGLVGATIARFYAGAAGYCTLMR